MADFIASQRKGRKLIHDNFEYVREKQLNDKVYWQCSRKGECKARAHTVDGEVVRLVNEHTHGPAAAKIEATVAYNKMKAMAASTDSTNQAIVAAVAETMSVTSLAHLPEKDTLKRTLRKVKALAYRSDPIPGTIQELEIPVSYRSTRRGDRFLRYDSGQGDPDRIIVFGSTKASQILSGSRCWFADGTFKVVPELFYQLYTVHAKFMNSVIPVFYILMTRKTQNMYTRVFEEIKRLCPDARPEQIMMDFEVAAISAFKSVFLGSSVRGCHFHFAQCIFRKIQGQGLQQQYSNDKPFGLQCQMLAALALVPANHVDDAFQALQDYSPPCLEPVLDYIEDTFIGRMDRRVRIQPQFGVDLWCHFDSILNGDPKTNNTCEAWHRGFQANVACSHPTIWRFLKMLLKEESLTMIRIEQLGVGVQEPKKRVYLKSAKNMKRLAECFAQTDIIEYLRGIAHNIPF